MTAHSLYLWHHSHSIGNITTTMFVNTYQLYLTWNTLFYTIQPLYMISHTSCLCVCDHTHSIDVIKHTLFMTSHLLYIWHNMQCIRHLTHDLWHHNTLLMTPKLLYLNSHQLYLRAHPLYLCHHPEVINHTTAIVCMITQRQYVWHHINYIWHHNHSLWYYSTLWHYTHCIHDITPRIPVIPSTVAGPLHIVDWL